MLRNYFKIAFRNLWRNRLYSLLNIGGLMLGLAFCLLIALFIVDEMSYDRFHANYDTIYRVVEKQSHPEGLLDVAVTPGPLAPSLVSDYPEIVETTRLGRWSGLLTRGTQTMETENMLIVDPTFFSLFSFRLLAGNAGTVFRNPDEVILTEAMAERVFGADWRQKNVVGQSFMFNKEHTLTLVGIAENPPVQSHIQFEVLLPFKWLEKNDEWSLKWNSNSYHTYVQLRPDAPGTSASLSEKIQYHIKRYKENSDTQLFLQPLSDVYLYSDFAFQSDWGKLSDILYVRIFSTLGLIVLLIAVINFINLATARSSHRAKEVGVRKSVGAQRSNLVGQFMGEALLMTALAVGCSLLMAETLLPLFNDLSGKELLLPYHSPVFWLVLVVITLLVGGLTGLYPAFYLSAFRPARVLKGIMDVRLRSTFRQSLVVVQFVLVVVLIVGAIVIHRQLAFVQEANLGFDQSHLLYVRLKGDLRAKALLFKNEVEQLPGVAEAAVATSNLVDINNSGTIEWEGQPEGDEFYITHMNVDPDFIHTTGISLVAGRNFSTKILSDTSSAQGAFLINETAARRMGWAHKEALGKKVKFWGVEGAVVGVVKDFHFQPLHKAIEPFILRYQPKDFYFTLLLKTSPGTIQGTLSEVAGIYKKLDPEHPFTYGFVDQDLGTHYRAEQLTGRIILYFSILTILVACLGLFGLITFSTEQRRKEIGVRKVLGASVAGIVSLLGQEYMKLLILAIVIASPIAAYVAHQWLQNFAYKISVEWWMFAGAGLLAVSIALLTVSFQSIRAALMNPVKSLRSE